jgi:S1-C subfamily serine protease
VIVEFDGEKVRGVRQLTRLVRETPVGRSVKMAVMRDGKRVDLTVVPEDRAAALTSRDRVLEETLRQLPERDQVFQFRMPDLGRLEVLPEGPYALLDRFSPSAGRLGVMVQEMTPQLAAYFGAKDGVLVTAVTDGSPAATAGLKAGDVITAVNNQAVTSSANLIRLLREAGDGAEVTIGLVRDRKPMTVKAKLESTKPAPRAIRRTIIV